MAAARVGQSGEMATQEGFNETRLGTQKRYESCQDFARVLGLFPVTGLMGWCWNK